MLNQIWLKWKRRKLFSKITDFLFVLLILALLTPTGRLVIGGFVNRVKANLVQPKLLDKHKVFVLSDVDFQWRFTDLNGKIYSLADFKGKTIFLNLWATWCPPCVGEMPSIQSLYERFKNNKKVKIVLVSNEKAQIVKKFMNEKGYTMPVYLGRVATPKLLSSSSIPVSFLITSDGKVVMKETGAHNWGGDKMAGIIKGLIKE